MVRIRRQGDTRTQPVRELAGPCNCSTNKPGTIASNLNPEDGIRRKSPTRRERPNGLPEVMILMVGARGFEPRPHGPEPCAIQAEPSPKRKVILGERRECQLIDRRRVLMIVEGVVLEYVCGSQSTRDSRSHTNGMKLRAHQSRRRSLRIECILGVAGDLSPVRRMCLSGPDPPDGEHQHAIPIRK